MVTAAASTTTRNGGAEQDRGDGGGKPDEAGVYDNAGPDRECLDDHERGQQRHRKQVDDAPQHRTVQDPGGNSQPDMSPDSAHVWSRVQPLKRAIAPNDSP